MAAAHACVVVCDDEADLRATVGEYLLRRGYAVMQTASASELYAALRAKPDVDLVILDIAMPGEDGLTALRRIRDEREIAVIMLTASSGLVDRVVGLELGADDYLGKPFEPREIEAQIKSVLRRTRGARAAPPLDERGSGWGRTGSMSRAPRSTGRTDAPST